MSTQNPTYELYFNWAYSKRKNPHLMFVGRTGGYGPTRNAMRRAVRKNNESRARDLFEQLVQETRAELEYDAQEIGATVDEIMQQFLSAAMSEPDDPQYKELVHYIREVRT